MPPISHRSDEYQALLKNTQNKLCQLTGARNVAIVVGSGTLANDMIAAQLRLLDERGLICSSGEFGERLIDHARRCGLRFDTARDLKGIQGALRRSRARWLWLCHCETSTGELYDLEVIKAVCNEHDIRLCLDSISSLGILETDLSGVYLASGVSGKGLASYPGLGLVFSNHAISHSSLLPRYLDLGLYDACSVPFTGSSNLLRALNIAVGFDASQRFALLRQKSRDLRRALENEGFVPIMPERNSSPAVFTLALEADSWAVGDWLQARGVLVASHSAYLRENNWLQICLMGKISRAAICALPHLLREAIEQCRNTNKKYA